LTNRSRVKDPHFLAKKQQKMPIFEKVEYWGLKDPLEVRVQHETCIYMGDTFSSHFEPKKIDRVGRRGQKQPKWGYFGTSKNIPFWLFLAPPADPVEFFWFKMAATAAANSGGIRLHRCRTLYLNISNQQVIDLITGKLDLRRSQSRTFVDWKLGLFLR
jgi:hypothetical protein